ncbi:MAG: glycolate oxidase subunit GlcF [Rhodospirillales bacterium]
MQTFFTPAQMSDPHLHEMNRILRSCVHCGFCLSTCPTYVLLGDELDSPRGRIYLIKDMLEHDKPATGKVVKHIDRCLSCLSCMTTCPSGVDYMHLIDEARGRIEKTHTRPLFDRMRRAFIAAVLPNPGVFRWSLIAAWIARPVRFLFPRSVRTMLGLTPRRLASPSAMDRPQVFPAEGERVKRVALLAGCVQSVLKPDINEATIRLLTRHGCEVVIAEGIGCCGALDHHMGREDAARLRAEGNIMAWEKAAGADGFDAIVVNASGCGTMLKDYETLFRGDYIFSSRAAKIAGRARDITEIMDDIGLRPRVIEESPAVAYHSACSMQHGQKITMQPKRLLEQAGFTVAEPSEGHLCCGSAGAYNLLQPGIAARLRDRKAQRLMDTQTDVVATGNIGCMMQLEGALDIPVVHTAELLDWATGGPKPRRLGETA